MTAPTCAELLDRANAIGLFLGCLGLGFAAASLIATLKEAAQWRALRRVNQRAPGDL